MKAAKRRGGQPPCRTDHPRLRRVQGAAGCVQGPLQGGDRPKPLAGATASMCGRPRAWLAPVGAAPAGVGSAHGQAARGRVARGQGCRQQGRSLLQGQRPCKAAPPAREVPPEGIYAYHRGGCPRRRRVVLPPTQGSGGDAVRVREEG
ncbi:hypothetical protein GW17_00041745 [Ensete ventricosum]|nr:hypothetical protein GW17_00041745 [Ensete ventricosum]